MQGPAIELVVLVVLVVVVIISSKSSNSSSSSSSLSISSSSSRNSSTFWETLPFVVFAYGTVSQQVKLNSESFFGKLYHTRIKQMVKFPKKSNFS